MRHLILSAILTACCILFPSHDSRASSSTYIKTNMDGLSSSSITCISQDSLGRLWVGTWDGLNVYDSNEFWVWMHDPADSNSISNNTIRSIIEQKDGIMWIATDYGINRLDAKTARIDRFYLGYEHKVPSDEKTFSISVSGSGRIFCSARDWGIAYFNESTSMMQAVNIPGFNTSGISGLHCLGDSRLLLISQDGTAYTASYTFSGNGQIDITGTKRLDYTERISSSYKCGRCLYIVSSGNRLYRYDETTASLSYLADIPVKDKVTALAETGNGTVAIGFLSSGIRFLDPETGWIFRDMGVSDANILYLYYGTQDILWAGTDGQGLWAMYDDPFHMEKITYSQISDSRTRYPVRAFCKSGDDLYVGTKGEGIFKIRNGHTAKQYLNELGSPSVFALDAMENGDILVGHDGKGFDIISGDSGTAMHLVPPEGKMFGSVYSFLPDKANGCIWIGTFGYGLVRLQTEKTHEGQYEIKDIRFYKRSAGDSTSISNNMVQPLVMEGDSILWIGTRGGLNRLDIRTDSIACFTTTSDNPLSSNEILSLHIGSDSTLWIGTGYGLNRLVRNPDGKYSFISYTTKDVLHNNTIHGIEEDDDGNLWLSTSHGLSFFNTGTGEVTNFYNDSKLQNNEYSDGAGYKDKDGYIYFGGIDGFNWFDPADIRARDFSPEVLISRVTLSQAPDIDLLNSNEEITLRYNENFFNVHFTALEYINNSNCEYSYRLKGFNNGWVNVETDHTASFTNVPPGRYLFQVRSTNGDKVWKDNTTELGIRITPPWWKSVWAYIAYSLLVCMAVLSVQFMISFRMRQKHKLELEELRRKQLSDTYEAKLRFFTNIAHEFTTPLTLICGPIEQIRNEFHLPAKVEKYHQIILSNAERMLRLIQELIDFRKADTGNEKPVFGKVDISALLNTIISNFYELNEEKQISIESEIAPDMTVVTDQGAMEKIFYNLVSNAYKYTPDGGWIHVSAENGRQGLVISVKNSGKGIKPEHIDLVFDRFMILDNYEYQASKGRIYRNGIGMALVNSLVKMLSGTIKVESEQGKFTMFTLVFPPVSEDRIDRSGAENARCWEMPEDKENGEDREITEAQVQETVAANKKNVMIIDDEAQIRDLVTDILGNEYNIITAGNGKIAVDKLRFGLPDLIISDLNMPEMNGVELLKWLKANPLTKFIPVIFLAFKTDIAAEIETYEMGSEVFIPKPFHPKHLKAVVHSILDSRSVLKDYYNSALSSTDIYEGAAVDSEDKKFLMKVTSAIEGNITDDNLSQNWLCEQLSISKMQFYRKLKSLTGQTPSEFIRSIKLEHAAHLLKTTRMTVQEVMFASGFNNKSYFYREFAEKFKMSPKEFRKDSNQDS